MRKTGAPLFTFAILAAACAACATFVPEPVEGDLVRARALDPAADLAGLRLGRRCFIAKCSGCHTLPEPCSLKPEDWPEQLDDMHVKAKLKPDERRLIEVYLRAVAERPPS